MSNAITTLRLHTQHLTGKRLRTAAEIVRWLGAMQAQDYAAVKWAIGLRTEGMTDADVDQALTNGGILRTHVLRPTWHVVAPEDIRWLLRLTAPRVHALNAYYYRKVGLGEPVFEKANTVLTQALRGGQQLTRTELKTLLDRAGVTKPSDENLRFIYILMHAELDEVLCSGGRRGKQFTYALLDERAPRGPELSRDAMLGKLAQRFFTGHGPAAVRDLAWWSSLSLRDCQRALELAQKDLTPLEIDGTTHWCAPDTIQKRPDPEGAWLLPGFDEYLIAYQEYRTSLNAKQLAAVSNTGGQTILLNGQIIGTWKRALSKTQVSIALQPFKKLTKSELRAIQSAADHYGRFLQLPAVLA